jgi:hypothetical protein
MKGDLVKSVLILAVGAPVVAGVWFGVDYLLGRITEAEIARYEAVLDPLEELLDVNNDGQASYDEWSPLYDHFGISPPRAPTLFQMSEYLEMHAQDEASGK